MIQINPIYPYFDDALKYQWQIIIEVTVHRT